MSVSYAEDSPQEIARQQEEAQREAEADAYKQARREEAAQAEAQHETEEAQREALEDTPPAPSPTPPPTEPTPPTSTDFIDVDVTLEGGASANNTDVGADSFNNASSTQTTTIDATNNNHDTSLDQSISVVSNTGDNVISGDPAPSPTPTPTPGPTPPPLPGCEDRPPLSIEEQQLEQEATPSAEPSAFLLFFIKPAYAQETEEVPEDFSQEGSTNENTGEFSESHATTTDSDALVASNKNCADIEDTTTATATSGQNNASGNDGGVTMTTGDATASGQLENWGNTNTVELTGDGALAQNQNTGASSDNFANAVEQDTITVDNTNFISVDNELTVVAVSGENLLVDNEGYNTLSTGNLELMAYLLNVLNMNITGKDFTHLIVNIFGNLTGEVDLDTIAENIGVDESLIQSVARNSETGANSTNTAEVLETTSVAVNNLNVADVRNTVEVTGISGLNDLSQGEDRILAYTGRIQILAAIMNFINSNFAGEDWYFAMVNVFGDLSGDILIPGTEEYLQGGAGVLAQNVNTGDGSTNDAEALLTSTITATNDNQANVVNNVTALADSGSNVSYNADDSVFMDTGTTDANGNILNWINYNLTGQNFVLLIVNVFGHWLGQVLAFPGEGDIDAPEDGTLVAIARGGGGEAGVAENVNTGVNSDNNVLLEHQFDVDAQNNNTATVENTINVAGISGQNTINENEDPAWLTTGWVDLDVGLLNIINFNVTGRNWMVLFVNVFGDFLGNVVFPGGVSTTGLAQSTTQEEAVVDDFLQEIPQQQNSPIQIAQTNQYNANTQNIANAKKGGELQIILEHKGPAPLHPQDQIQDIENLPEEDEFLIVSSISDSNSQMKNEKQVSFAWYGIMIFLAYFFLLIVRRRKVVPWGNLPIPRIPLP